LQGSDREAGGVPRCRAHARRGCETRGAPPRVRALPRLSRNLSEDERACRQGQPRRHAGGSEDAPPRAPRRSDLQNVLARPCCGRRCRSRSRPISHVPRIRGFMKRLARCYRGRRLHVVLDNSSTHSTPAVHAWLAEHPEIQFHFTPKGASWLNMVEAWVGILTRKTVRRPSFESVRALLPHISRD